VSLLTRQSVSTFDQWVTGGMVPDKDGVQRAH
jgi:hypothetical protein